MSALPVGADGGALRAVVSTIATGTFRSLSCKDSGLYGTSASVPTAAILASEPDQQPSAHVALPLSPFSVLVPSGTLPGAARLPPHPASLFDVWCLGFCVTCLVCLVGCDFWCHTFFKAFCSIMGQLFTLFGKSKFIPNSLAPSRFLYSLNEQPHHRCMQAHGAVLVSTRMVACFQMHLHYNGFRCKLSHFNRKAWW